MPSAFIPSIFSYPAVPLAWQLVHHWYVHPGPLVLRTDLLKLPTPTTDRDRTVSRRSEPSSRTALMGEQPNPWNRLQLQDAMSRHRGAKPPSMWTLGGDQPVIPRVAFIRWATAFPFSTAGSLSPTFVPARLVGLAVKHPYAFALCAWFPSKLRVSLGASVTLWEATPQSNCPPDTVPLPVPWHPVRTPIQEE